MPSGLHVGQPAPDFTLPSTQGEITLSRIASERKVAVAFYVEDNTPVCTSELAALKGDYGLVQDLGAVVVAVSVDGLEAHQDFSRRLGGAPFPLVSDANLEAARMYGVVDETGKRSRRAIFVIDRGGVLVHEISWYSPANSGQYEEIFRALGLQTG